MARSYEAQLLLNLKIIARYVTDIEHSPCQGLHVHLLIVDFQQIRTVQSFEPLSATLIHPKLGGIIFPGSALLATELLHK